MHSDLVKRYGQDRLPRYTSYPTAPLFSPSISESDYRRWLKAIPSQQPASIYAHVPFCRSICWYCGCHTSITQHDHPITHYVAGLRTEAHLVAEAIGQRQPISHVHFGGGTPTIMTPETFAYLVEGLRYSFSILPDAEIAVEIDPRTLSEPMTEVLGIAASIAPASASKALIPSFSTPSNAFKASNKLLPALRCCGASASTGSISISSTASFSDGRLHVSIRSKNVFKCVRAGFPCSVTLTFLRSRNTSARSPKKLYRTVSNGTANPRRSPMLCSKPDTFALVSITSHFRMTA